MLLMKVRDELRRSLNNTGFLHEFMTVDTIGIDGVGTNARVVLLTRKAQTDIVAL